MAAISQADIRLCGSHAGVSIGEDGPSQMALEDLASMRAVHGSTVLYPCDPNQTAKLVAEMADREGIVFMRTTRAATPTVYGADEDFPIGGSRVLRQGVDVAIVPAGITPPAAPESPAPPPPRVREGGRPARRRGHRRASDRPLLVQARRCADPARGGRGDRRPDPDRR